MTFDLTALPPKINVVIDFPTFIFIFIFFLPTQNLNLSTAYLLSITASHCFRLKIPVHFSTAVSRFCFLRKQTIFFLWNSLETFSILRQRKLRPKIKLKLWKEFRYSHHPVSQPHATCCFITLVASFFDEWPIQTTLLRIRKIAKHVFFCNYSFFFHDYIFFYLIFLKTSRPFET